MRVSVLGSGSRGNAVFVEAGETRILVDAGFSGRQLAERLERIGVPPSSLAAILITHEHGDHTRGMGVFARKFGTPLYLTDGTREACRALLKGTEAVRPYRPGHPLTIDALRIDPFLTAHDAVDPVAVTVSGVACGSRLGIATDLGRPTAGVRHALQGCHLLVLEANHDESLLRSGPYPPSVQARIASSHGHLSNRAAAEFALELLHPGLAGILLAHLSGECNRPDLARETVRKVLRRRGWKGFVDVAPQEAPTPLVDLPALRSSTSGRQLSLL